MEKIDSTSPFFNPTAYSGLNSDLKKTREKPKVKSFFFSLLEKTKEETEILSSQKLPISEETVKNLLDEIHSAGDALKKHPLPVEILRYRSAVRDFLHFVVQNAYDVEKQYIRAGPNRRKEKTLIQIVDQKLDQLAAGILSGQSAQIEILTRLEEITGILIDLLR